MMNNLHSEKRETAKGIIEGITMSMGNELPVKIFDKKDIKPEDVIKVNVEWFKRQSSYLNALEDEFIVDLLKEKYDIDDNQCEVYKNIDLELIEKIKKEVSDLIYRKDEDMTSEVITNYILENYNIWTTNEDVNNEMWYYNDGIYVPYARTFLKKICEEILEIRYTSHRLNRVLAKVEARTIIDKNKFFENKNIYELPVLNGILNIVTRELIPFNPNKIFFTKCPVKYNPDVKCELIDKFLSDVLSNPEDKKVFYEMGGYCLLKEYTHEKAFMLVGSGRNGKSKSIELIKRVLGKDNCISLQLDALTYDNPDLYQLHGKLANIGMDIANTELKSTSMFKSLTGRDMVTSRRKFLNAISFENFAKFIFACNELPKVYDATKGFWDRWILLEYPYYFAGKEEFENKDLRKNNWKIRDENIIEKICTEEEISGLLNGFLDGLKRLMEDGKFSSTMGTEEIKKMWIRKADSFSSFCMDNIEEDFDGIISKKALRVAFMRYCKKYGLKGVSDIAIKVTLQNEFGADDFQRKGNFGDMERAWKGIRFKEKID